jgi:dienelactone hydrolase
MANDALFGARLPEWRRTPDAEWGAGGRDDASVLYEGEPYRGKATRVFAYYGVPDERPNGDVPGIVLVHGGGGTAFPQWVKMWHDRGYAALSMDLGGRGGDGDRLPDGGPEQGHEEKFHAVGEGLEEMWSYHAVAAVVRGLSLLGSLPGVDADRIGVTGISWGGYMTCMVAGVDDRIRAAIPVYGCGFLHHNSCWLEEFERLSDDHRAAWIEHFDPSSHLPNAAMPMLWVNGTNDFAYPMDSYQESYRATVGETTLCIKVGMDHGHEPGWAPAEIGLFADLHLRDGEVFPEIGATRIEDGRAVASWSSARPIASAGLHVTKDVGSWPERAWETTPATIVDGVVHASLPGQRPLIAYLTIEDDRGVTVSSEHAAAE